MAVEQSAFRYGIRFSQPTYVIRVDIDTGDFDNLTFPATGSLDPTVDYFFLDDGSANDLCQILEDCLMSHASGGFTTVTVDLEPANLSLLITCDAFIQLLWSDAATTLDATIFGYLNSADSDADTEISSPNLPMGLVYLTHPVSIDSRSRQPLVGGISRSISGLTRAATFGTPLKERALSVSLMTEGVALDEYAPATTPYATFESMHVRAAGLGHAIHFVPDATLPLDYIEMHLAPPLVDNLRRDDTYRLRWHWNADFIVDEEFVDGTPAPPPGLGSGSSAGAPVDAQYVTLAANATLTQERVLTEGAGITITDGGANSTVTIATDSGVSAFVPNGLIRGFGWWVPAQANNGQGTHHGIWRESAGSGTRSTPAPTNASFRESIRRWRMVSGTGAGVGFAGERSWNSTGGDGRFAWRGDGAGLGGFFLAILGLSIDLTSGANCFFGLYGQTSSGGVGSGGTPSAELETIALGADNGDTNLQILHNDGAGSATKVDLGIAKSGILSRVYDVFFYAEPNGTNVQYRLIRRDAAGDTSGTLSSNLPTDTVLMGLHQHVGYPGGSVAASAYECRGVYAEWDIGQGVEHYGYF